MRINLRKGKLIGHSVGTIATWRSHSILRASNARLISGRNEETMNRMGTHLAVVALLCRLVDPGSAKGSVSRPELAREQRAATWLHRMTLEEKASQLINQARAVRD